MTTPWSKSPISPMVIEATLETWAATGRCSTVPVQGYSMWPLLLPGDVAWVVHGRQGLRVGDIVAYRLGELLVIHRLLRRQHAGMLLLAGDNQLLADRPVPLHAALGRVVAVDSCGRRLRFNSPRARAAAWILVICFALRSRGRLPRLTVWLRRLAVCVLRR